MTTGVRIHVTQGTPEWLEARRTGITSTDLPALLGVSPWTVEADVATEKLTGERPPVDVAGERRMRLGKRLEDAVRSEDEVEHGIRLRRVNQLVRHPELPWALTSLDFERVGERTIVEAKTSASRSRFADGLPDDIEAQVRWQMGVAGYPRVHVALLRAGQELECFDLVHDEATFANLVTVAEDFRRRLAAGGPFAQSAESLRRRYPRDNGGEMAADADLDAAVHALRDVRGRIADLKGTESGLESAIKDRMGEVAVLTGTGFRVTWKRTRDRSETDWQALAAELLEPMAETDRAAVVGRHVTVREGFRPLRVTWGREEES